MPRHGSLQPLCGCWYLATTTRQYIPQVDLKAHSTILSASSRTILTQTFINPTSRDLGDVKYTFPLHDGVSIVGFKCEIDNRVIRGIVKERGKAKIEYQQAVQKGQAAALLEQSTLASDTFTTSIGKFPVGSKAVVEIIYLGELQHDAQSDGVRFSIPSIICPRYANSSVDTHELSQSLATLVQRGAINITVDVSVDKGSSIRGLQSPSHPIAITLGRTSVAAQDVFEANLASATLTMQQGNLFFDEDFVLIVNAKDQDVPSAFVETHPTIPNQRAIMATLVPKFNIPNNNPEIVFIIDRSGSMGGKIQTLQTALRVFLKSLPVGVKFNICSFGSSHSFMWKKSQAYDASSLKAALKYVDSVSANLGGTEILAPVRATVERRLKDLDLDILLLSDGEIWDQNTLFSYINKAVSDQPIRLFSLGIGSGASQSLIEGIARAGDGLSACLRGL
ncbi:von Willebrand domain-containing protein [Histoplasma capsulatum H143]|uniref:von Willebrand domain-containing protein n=1 Tax=Ajellomyces capsulatus (strain H143) TaxID=544712 RepID=C6HN15_AJECH|nr:von Willebrand domain-containing protein [Histoplasma capsulatum H143]